MPTAEVEIALRGEGLGVYGIQLRFVRPDSDAEIQPVEGRTRFDLDALRAGTLDPAEYGKILTRDLFTDPQIREKLGEARAVAEASGFTLRLRLLISPSAPELHGLRWETLADPRTGEWLLTSETLIFSRLVGGPDWRPVRLRPRGALRALVVVASPDLGNWRLAPIDVERELERARAGLGDIPISTLEPGVRATLPNLAEALRRTEWDILYLVCHGMLDEGEPWLLLESPEGKAVRIGGRDLVEQLRDLEVRPRLVVLASCESAGRGEGVPDTEAFAALGPRLAEAGVPAVLAMQGSVSMETLSRLLPAFFRELREDGRVDHALAVARSEVRDASDRWMPALFLRLKNGRIWYVPGFAGEDNFQRWKSLLNNIVHNRCTPILGSGLLEALVGSSHEIAEHLAEAHRFPLEPHEREDLPQVAQYLATMEQDQFVRDQWVETLQKRLTARFGAELEGDGGLPGGHVGRLAASFSRAGSLLRQRDPAEPHKVLASLPFPLYITTNPDALLVDALQEADRQPQVELCRWRQDLDWPPSIYDDRSADYEATAAHPLVYYLFGRLQEPESIVLTEDNYFDYLIGVSQPAQDSPHPHPVLKAQGGTALLFLGFKMDDWDFRIFFRSLRGREGSGWNKRLTHVAVQIDPEEGRMLDAARARDYLRQYFGEAKIDIYWGNVTDFLRELMEQWTRWKAANP